jgi:hypothetical protein
MSISLVDALRQVDLQSGSVYQCQIGRFRVEVRVDENVPETVPTPLERSDVMLDPWTDFPALPPGRVVQAAPAPPVLPDLPDLPTDAPS